MVGGGGCGAGRPPIGCWHYCAGRDERGRRREARVAAAQRDCLKGRSATGRESTQAKPGPAAAPWQPQQRGYPPAAAAYACMAACMAAAAAGMMDRSCCCCAWLLRCLLAAADARSLTHVAAAAAGRWPLVVERHRGCSCLPAIHALMSLSLPLQQKNPTLDGMSSRSP